MTFDGKCRQKSGNISGFGEICGVKTVFVMCRYGMLRLLGRNSWRFLSLSVSEGVTEFVGLCFCLSLSIKIPVMGHGVLCHCTPYHPPEPFQSYVTGYRTACHAIAVPFSYQFDNSHHPLQSLTVTSTVICSSHLRLPSILLLPSI